MDPLKRPLQIPPSFPIYSDKHEINKIFSDMLEALLIKQPDDPLKYLVKHLSVKRLNPVDIRVAVVGPPGSGKSVVADHIVKTTGAVKINKINNWNDVIKQIEAVDNNGFVLDGFPQTRQDCLKLQESGILLTNLIELNGPKEMLFERQNGKKRDPHTGIDTYHSILNWTEDNDVISRLVDSNREEYFESEYSFYQKNKNEIYNSYKSIISNVNADQLLGDIEGRVFQLLSQPRSNKGKRTARTILIGPPGSGKRLIAQKLSKKWNILPIDVQTEIDKEILRESRLGEQIKKIKNQDEGLIPNSLIIKVVANLIQSRQASIHGWTVFNFPLQNGEQLVQQFAHSQFTPNRIVRLVLDIETVRSRLCYRIHDPINGEEYHKIFNPPPNKQINDRCLIRESDGAEHVTSRFINYESGIETFDDLIQEFGGFKVNSDQDPETVYQIIESKLDKPLPFTF